MLERTLKRGKVAPADGFTTEIFLHFTVECIRGEGCCGSGLLLTKFKSKNISHKNVSKEYDTVALYYLTLSLTG